MELLQRSEAALFQAKQQGRSCYAFYTEAMTHKAIERVQLGIRLRRAIELHELQVVYQPQTELESGAIVGAEALMRWQSRELGIISPARFIPLAEELGCIAEMGEWILREVCRQGRIWLDQGLRPVTLAVNLSPIQFQQEDIKQTVAGILAETCFPAELLELELTESALMQQGRRTIELLKNLRELGVRLALDDFGTGYSSLAYLKHFPLHLLKIDKSFIDEIHLDTKDMQLVSTIILMAKSMGFKVLAEGVELQQQLDTLKGLKCDLYQGYLKSKPLQPHEFAVLLAEQARKI
jgi:EAL domain-containing protein (putative c-di-GMP-specific phosphodiesterase class I)